MTYDDVLMEARVLLQDTEDAPYRYTNAILLPILNRGLRAIAMLRPDACFETYSRSRLNVPIVTAETLSDEFAFDEIFQPGLVEYLVGMAEIVDDEFTNDGRAITLLQRFRTGLVSV
jgi:hypothetical protein